MALVVVDCPHCPANHVTLTCSSFVRFHSEYIAISSSNCPVCLKPIGLKIKSYGSSHSFVHLATNGGSLASLNWQVEEIWPKPEQTIAPSATPDAISRNFIQAENAAKSGYYDAAGMTYRRVLELTIKEKYPSGSGTLAKRIRDYAESGGLTASMREWADTVRVIGNESAHDEAEPGKEDIDDLAAFSRVMLEYLYTMPAKVAARSGQAPPTQPPPA